MPACWEMNQQHHPRLLVPDRRRVLVRVVAQMSPLRPTGKPLVHQAMMPKHSQLPRVRRSREHHGVAGAADVAGVVAVEIAASVKKRQVLVMPKACPAMATILMKNARLVRSGAAG